MDVPPGPVEFEASNELERLRRRAYGPDADIAGDTAARARLSELETAHRRQLTHTDGPVADSGSVHGAPAPPWWPSRRLTVLGGAIAALTLIVAVVVWMSLRATNDVPAPDYVLALESVGESADAPKDPYGTLNLPGLSSEEVRRYEDFRGLGVWGGESRYGMSCLLVAQPAQGLLGGIGDAKCAPDGRFDAIVDLYIRPGYSAPDAFASLPAGSLIRFVLRGDHVDVYLGAADPTAPHG